MFHDQTCTFNLQNEGKRRRRRRKNRDCLVQTNRSCEERREQREKSSIDKQIQSLATIVHALMQSVFSWIQIQVEAVQEREREGDALTAFDGSAASVVCSNNLYDSLTFSLSFSLLRARLLVLCQTHSFLMEFQNASYLERVAAPHTLSLNEFFSKFLSLARSFFLFSLSTSRAPRILSFIQSNTRLLRV